LRITDVIAAGGPGDKSGSHASEEELGIATGVSDAAQVSKAAK